MQFIQPDTGDSQRAAEFIGPLLSFEEAVDEPLGVVRLEGGRGIATRPIDRLEGEVNDTQRMQVFNDFRLPRRRFRADRHARGHSRSAGDEDRRGPFQKRRRRFVTSAPVTVLQFGGTVATQADVIERLREPFGLLRRNDAVRGDVARPVDAVFRGDRLRLFNHS